MIDKTIKASVNYTLTKADESIIDLIFQEVGHKNLKGYNGKYKDQITQREGHNLVPLGIRSSFASLIAGNTVTPTFKANYCALGSDGTPATILDTQLGAETIRGLLTNRFALDNIAYLDKFWSSGEVGGNTFLEVGLFIDGTAAVNSGFLLSKININETMSATETLTINAVITID